MSLSRLRADLLAIAIGLTLGAAWGFYRWTKITEIHILTTVPDLVLLSPESIDLLSKLTGYNLKVQVMTDTEKIKSHLHAVNLLPDLIIAEHDVFRDKFVSSEMMKLPEDILELVHEDFRLSNMDYFLSLFWDVSGNLSNSDQICQGQDSLFYSDWVTSPTKTSDQSFMPKQSQALKIIGVAVTQSPERTHVWRWLRQILKSNYIQFIANKERRGFTLNETQQLQYSELKPQALRTFSLLEL